MSLLLGRRLVDPSQPLGDESLVKWVCERVYFNAYGSLICALKLNLYICSKDNFSPTPFKKP